MIAKDYISWVFKSRQLTNRQRERAIESLTSKNVKNQGVPPSIANAVPDTCPHCGQDHLVKRGWASQLQRWGCKNCGKTFNVLTNTPLARLRKKDKWLDNSAAMIDGKTIATTAEECDIHYNTAFRWRHRFLNMQQYAQNKDLTGIAESDETYFYRSEKGSRTLDRAPRKRGGDKISRGLSKDLVPVVNVVERSGRSADRVAVENLTLHAHDLFHCHVRPDALLITDGSTQLCAAAKATRSQAAHLSLPGEEGRGVKGCPFHLQTVNSLHSKIHTWMRRFNGVATKYLGNYIGWHRHLKESTHGKNPDTFIQLAFNPLGVNAQLTVI